jgi:hypothetical protein
VRVAWPSKNASTGNTSEPISANAEHLAAAVADKSLPVVVDDLVAGGEPSRSGRRYRPRS